MYQADNDLRRYFDNNPGRLLYKWLHYFEIYDHHFRRYRGKPVNIVEIGVFNGGSLQLWQHYFGPQARIYGVDIDPRCKQFEEENIRILIGDQADRDFLRRLKEEIPRPDILIDDGGHLMHQQITTFEELYPFVADDGVYLCEDLHTSYWPNWGGGLGRPGTFVEFAKKLVDSLNAYHIRQAATLPVSITQSAHSLHFYDSILVIEKQRRETAPVDKYTGTRVFEAGTIGSFPKPLLTFAVLTSDKYGSSRAENRLFIPNSADPSRFKLAYGGWKDDAGSYVYDEALIRAADGYVIHGLFPDKLSSDVLDHIFSSGKPVIYFFEEALPELAGNESITKRGFRRYLLETLKLAHLVVVETEAQKAAYQGLTPRITVLPHKLDTNRYPTLSPSPQESLNVIYQGVEGHLENLLPIVDALKQAADQYPGRIEFHFFGRGLVALGKHPAFHFHPAPAGADEWGDAIRQIRPSLALLPLLDASKQKLSSMLPLLEYAAYGIPVLASNVPPFRDWVLGAHTGFLVDNDPGAWQEAIENCRNKANERTLKGQQARLWLEKEHAVAQGTSGQAEVFEQALRNAASVRAGKPPVDFMHLHEKPGYQKWLTFQQLQPRDVLWMENEMSGWEQPPCFHLLMTLLPAQTQWLQATLDSLSTQANPHWELTIVAFTPQPAGLSLDSRVHWYEVSDDEDSYDALNRFATDANFDWIGFIEAGDRLPPQALFKFAFHARRVPRWQVLYSDEDQISADADRSNPLFKPDFNPDLLHSYPYTGGLCLFSRELCSAIGGVNGEKDGAEIYDLLLRCTEHIAYDEIGHLAEILYSRFEQGGHSVRSWDEISQSSAESLREHFARREIAAEVSSGPYKGTHSVTYPLDSTPLVSILIPTRDRLDLIKPCIDTLIEKTDYPNYEVIVLDNGSQEADVLEYLGQISQHPNIRVLDYPHPFNFSALCNYGARQAKGEFLLLLNNDTEVIEPQWLTEMVRHGLRPEVGVVGARLLFPNGKLQHAGIIIGVESVASHPFGNASPDHPGYMMRARLTQNLSAVTGACMLVRKDLYESLEGLDETDLKVLYNDVDFCLRVRERGALVVWAPAATLVHKTSASIESSLKAHAAGKRLPQASGEHHAMCRRWLDSIAHDPAYNRNLSQASSFTVETDEALCWDPAWRPAPRILAYPGDLQGCGEYRIIAPCRALNKAGRIQAHVSEVLYYPNQLAKVDPDIVLLQRQIEDKHLYSIDGLRRYSRAFRVFEIDDLVHAPPPKNPSRVAKHGDELERMIEAISSCDRLVTTTPYLADFYGRFCKDVKIIPNYLERAKWGQFTPIRLQGKKPRIGWAGSDSHMGDLELLHPVIMALHKEVDWVFFGICPETLRPFIHEFHGQVSLDHYPARLASLNLDLAVAPLENLPFNEAKSALKILECGILGYPVICTDMAPYKGDFPVTRVSNNPQEWIEAIRHAITDREAIAMQGDELRLYIKKHWMLEDNLEKWLEGWLP